MKLKYDRYNNSENIITIDLHNNYTVIALSVYNPASKSYLTSFFLKENSVDTWKLMEEYENIEFFANRNTIGSAILKYVSTLSSEGLIHKYINRYKYELKCFDKGNEFFEQERLGVA